MATIPLNIARYVREDPAESPHRNKGATSGNVKKPENAPQQAEAEAGRLTGTSKRFEDFLNDPLVRESGRSRADGLLTSQGAARVAGTASAEPLRPEAHHALLESNSVSLMAALGAQVSHKSFPTPVLPAAAVPAAPKNTGEKKQAAAPQAPASAAAKTAGYASEPSVRKAAQDLKRRMLQLDPNAEKWARNLFANQAGQSFRPSGRLSAVFESGKDGIEAIGYDRRGGTSYGKYQIASRTGTMDRFITYLKAQEPEWAERLQKAGPANTGGTKGEMPGVWKDIANKHPKRFEQLQDAFILQSHYEPALKHIMAENKVDLDSMDPAIKEVLLSTSVQHGPNGAADIFSEAMRHAGAKGSQNFDEKLIKEIYESRSSDFPSSSGNVQRAVRSRLMREEALALTLLDDDDVKSMF